MIRSTRREDTVLYMRIWGPPRKNFDWLILQNPSLLLVSRPFFPRSWERCFTAIFTMMNRSDTKTSVAVYVAMRVCLCVCLRACMAAHLKYYAARVPPAHLFSTCSTCISASLVFGFMSPCGQSFKDMHPCVSGSPLLDPPRVV